MKKNITKKVTKKEKFRKRSDEEIDSEDEDWEAYNVRTPYLKFFRKESKEKRSRPKISKSKRPKTKKVNLKRS